MPNDNYLIYLEFTGLLSYTFVLLLQYCPVPDHGLSYADEAAAVLAAASLPRTTRQNTTMQGVAALQKGRIY